METPQKSYFAIVPANVRYDKNLMPNAKLLYGEISALTNEKGFCWAGDGYFSDLYQVNKATIQKWLKSLEDNGHIKREVKYKEGSREIEHRYITLRVYPTLEKECTPTLEKAGDNNTLINNTNNNSNTDLETQTDKIPFLKIISYLNKKTGRNYRNVEGQNKYIRARWNEGYRYEDFIKVINNKVADAARPGSLFDSKYLQPSTLFGPKFDQYLNQTPAVVRDQPKESIIKPAEIIVPEEFRT